MIFKDVGVEWVPVKISYNFPKDNFDLTNNYIPKNMQDWPDHPTPSLLGFDTKDIGERMNGEDP